jgi:BMFP domain-containing protein YqiC
MRQFDNKQMFDDVARLATGAVGALSGFRQHLRQEIKTHLDRFLIELDLVPLSDFETVEQMAKQARADNAELKKRLDALEGKKTPATKPTKSAAPQKAPSSAKKPSARKA